MINKESVNKARSLYYGLLSKMFVFTTSQERYAGVVEALDGMIENPIDENSGEALKEIKSFIIEKGEEALIQEYDDVFHNPAYKVVRNTASYYDEGVESGHMRVAVKNFLAKTRIRRDEKNYKEKIQLMQGVMQSIVDGDYKKWCNNIGVVEPLRETDDTDLECAFE